MVKKIIIILVVAFILPSLAIAAEFTASVSQKQAAIGQSIALKLELSGASKEGNPNISPLKKYFNINGRGQSSSTMIINGRVSSSTSWNYTLQPKKGGNITIPIIAIDTSEGTLETEPITISVGKASSLPTSDNNDRIIISAKVSKRNPYKNEPITYTATLLSHYEMANISLSELTLEDVIVEQNGEPKIYDSTQNGVAVKIIKASYIITPLKAGKIIIPATTIQGGIPITRNNNSFGTLLDQSFDPFDMMGDFNNLLGSRELKPFAVASKPITLEVAPPVAGVSPWLPATSLKISENWDDSQSFKVGEPITRSFTILAEGVSASQLLSLEEQLGDDVKVYADQPISDEYIKDGKIRSWRQENYTIIPQQSGQITLPEIRIKWWDVNEKKIAYATVPQRILDVAEGEPLRSYTPPVTQVQNKNTMTPTHNLQTSMPQIELPATVMQEQDNRLFYALIAGLVAILLFVVFWVISLQRKVVKLAEVKITDSDEAAPKAKVHKKTPVNNKGLKNIKTPSDLQKHLQNYAHQHWGLPKNTPLEEISQWIEKHSPELKKDVDQLFEPLLAALYADKDLDIDKVKKHCASIIKSMQKQQKSSEYQQDKLPNLNPS